MSRYTVTMNVAELKNRRFLMNILSAEVSRRYLGRRNMMGL